MTSARTLMNFNLRAELRLALLAAAEACWLYAIVLTIGTLMGFPRVVSPIGIFVVYWVGLLIGRVLPRSDRAWRVLQGLTVVLALLAIIVAMRVGYYTELPWFDFSWLGTFFGRVITFFERVTAEELSTLILIVAFVRALGFAQRPLTLWVIGFQFRLGIVIFFLMAFLAALTIRVDFIFWIFGYFALSLIGISLARIEEAGREHPLGLKWALVLSATIAATMLLGFGTTQFLTLDAVNAFFALLSPLTFLIQILVTIISIPFFYLFEILIRLLAPVFERLLRVLTGIFPDLNFTNPETLRVVTEVSRQLENIFPYLRLIGIILVILGIAWYIARALNRRVKWQEHEQFARETLDERDESISERRKRRATTREQRRHVHAENVRRIYAALQLHAERLGLKRNEAETPFEFLPRLVTRFPDAAPEIDTITRAYCDVHYAMQDSTETQVRELRAVWQSAKKQMTNDGGRTTKV